MVRASKTKLHIVKEYPDTDEEFQKKKNAGYEIQLKKDEEMLAKMKKDMADSKELLLTEYSPELKAMCYKVVVRLCAHAKRKDGKEPTEGVPKNKLPKVVKNLEGQVVKLEEE